MTDLLIRDVPDHITAAIDAKAKRLGLSRTAYVRRQLTQAESLGEPAQMLRAHWLSRACGVAVDG